MSELRELHLSELLTILAEVPGDRAESFATAIRMAKELELRAGLGTIANAHNSKRLHGCEEAIAQRDAHAAELRTAIVEMSKALRFIKEIGERPMEQGFGNDRVQQMVKWANYGSEINEKVK